MKQKKKTLREKIETHPQAVTALYKELHYKGHNMKVSDIGRLELRSRDGKPYFQMHHNIDQHFEPNFEIGDIDWGFDDYLDFAHSLTQDSLEKSRKRALKLVTQMEDVKINIEKENFFSKVTTNIEKSFLDLFPFYKIMLQEKKEDIVLLNPSKGTLVRCAKEDKKWPIVITAPIGNYSYLEYKEELLTIMGETDWPYPLVETTWEKLDTNYLYYASFHANKALYKNDKITVIGFELNPGVAKMKGVEINEIMELKERNTKIGYKVKYRRNDYDVIEMYKFQPPYYRYHSDVVEEWLMNSKKYWHNSAGVFFDMVSSFRCEVTRKAKLLEEPLFPIDLETTRIDKFYIEDEMVFDDTRLIDTMARENCHSTVRNQTDVWSEGYRADGYNIMRTPYTTDLYYEKPGELYVETNDYFGDYPEHDGHWYIPVEKTTPKRVKDGQVVENGGDLMYCVQGSDGLEPAGNCLIRLIEHETGYIRYKGKKFKKVVRCNDFWISLLELCMSYRCDHNWMHISGAKIRYPIDPEFQKISMKDEEMDV